MKILAIICAILVFAPAAPIYEFKLKILMDKISTCQNTKVKKY